MIPYKQLSLGDIFSDCQNILENDKPEFLSLLESHIALMKLFHFLLKIIFMHLRVESTNIL